MIGMHKFWRDVDHKLRVLQHADITDFILILGETDLGLFRYPFHDLAELAETLDRLKAVRLQDQFGFQILHAIQRRSVGVERFWLGNSRRAARRLGSRLEDVRTFSIV
jgi:hypothetical protein